MKEKPIPTEPYPRILWYQEKRAPCTEEERNVLFKRYFDITVSRLQKKFKKTINNNLNELATEKANKLVESEIHLPTIMKKIVVESAKEHMITKRMLEESETFLQWYQE